MPVSIRLFALLTGITLLSACGKDNSSARSQASAKPPADAGFDASGVSSGPPDARPGLALLDGATGMRGSVTAKPEDEAGYVYDPSELRSFELQLSESDLKKIDSDPVAEEYVPGMLLFEGKSYDPVGIRYKGSVGGFVGCTGGGGFPPSGPKTCAKLSMKVSFDWMDPEGRFFGLKKLLFHAMNSDSSLMRDRLAYSLFRDMGVPAPRSTHARLLINGKLAGLFALVEPIDGRYTRARFSDGGEGNLYKETWPMHASEQVYLDALETHREASPSAIKMLDFAQRLSQADDAALPALIDSRMNREVTLAYVAVDRTIRNDDGAFHWYCAVPPGQGNNPGPWGNHNYYFYEETSSNQVWLIPWDMDLSFRGESQITPITTAWNAKNPSCDCVEGGPFGTGQRAPSCDPLIRGWASMGDDFNTQVRAFVKGPFSAEQVTAKLDAWAKQVAPVVEEAAVDPQQLSVGAWETALVALRGEVEALRTAAAP